MDTRQGEEEGTAWAQEGGAITVERFRAESGGEASGYRTLDIVVGAMAEEGEDTEAACDCS